MAGSLGEFEQLIMLAVLRLGQDAYGVTIRRAIEESTGRSLSAGAVYSTLGRLETRGLVSSRVGETVPERQAVLHALAQEVTRAAGAVIEGAEGVVLALSETKRTRVAR